uniref:Relaxin-3 n=1 Tax=Astyanax mexicanus TaxID=7994 RepID=A0A3B1JXT6_ASTMX
MWKAAVLATCLLLAGVKAMNGPTYGVKLCGREFIRAVIFTCGGSRWRRSIMSSGKDNTGSGEPGWEHQEQVFNRPARSILSEEVLEALRTSSRKGRDVVVGLSNACCKWGCSKSEISSLC